MEQSHQQHAVERRKRTGVDVGELPGVKRATFAIYPSSVPDVAMLGVESKILNRGKIIEDVSRSATKIEDSVAGLRIEHFRAQLAHAMRAECFLGKRVYPGVQKEAVKRLSQQAFPRVVDPQS